MTQQQSQLAENRFQPFPLGYLRPSGWLFHQLQLQAQGLVGHLDECWPDVAQSGWIGGTSEEWERGPYWLDGLIPLAFLLQDAALQRKVARWVDAVLTRQQDDGWLGPIHDPTYGYAYDPWPVAIILKALIQYQGATGDSRILPALLRFFRCLQQRVIHHPLQSWVNMRSADLLLSLFWTYEQTNEAWLLDLAGTLRSQGYNWIEHFAHFAYPDRQQRWQQETHVVNCSMAIKQPGLWYRLSPDEAYRQAAFQIMETLDRFHGQVTGVFSGDEVLAGANPSQGTELCAVVEYLFSLEVLIALWGEIEMIDRWERIAFNALPAPFAPDMWSHQYDQQVNQVLCAVVEDLIYTTNGSNANIFGLEPNFGCCTANMGQGWPKFAAHAWMQTQDAGLAVLSYVPCQLTTVLSGQPLQVEVDTDYPFTETVRMIFTTEEAVQFPLVLRIPSWAAGATLQIGDRQEEASAGTWHRIERVWSGKETLTLHLPMHLRTQTRYHQSVTLERGPLVYALPLGEAWKQIGGELPHADWEVHPTTPWNYALQVDRQHPERSCQIRDQAMHPHPFSPEHAPIHLLVKGRRLPTWTLEQHAAGPLPFSPVVSQEPLQELTLIPYGCTNLRICEFPTLE